jgi:hypothetical protein
MSAVALPYAVFYETVAASQTAQALGVTGAKGDILAQLIITVTATATSTVTLLDGAISYPLIVATTPVGVYSITFNAQSVSGAWKITTGAGATVFATGNFT